MVLPHNLTVFHGTIVSKELFQFSLCHLVTGSQLVSGLDSWRIVCNSQLVGWTVGGLYVIVS